MLRPARPSSLAASALIASLAFVAFLPLSCTRQEPQTSTYFNEVIGPILTASCVRTNTGAACHVADPKGNALGNLDTSTFDGVNHRRDLLINHGPYGQPALLAKNIPDFAINVQVFDGTTVPIKTNIQHVGGKILDPTASGYQVLRRWLDNGATENNSGLPASNITRLPCVEAAPPAYPGFDPTHDPTNDPGFATFKSTVLPFVAMTCAAGNCHGVPTNVFPLFCGQSDATLRWDFWAFSQYVTAAPGDGGSVADSQIITRPLYGGTYHEGGVIFQNVNDQYYKMFLQWATERGPAQFTGLDPNFQFFADRVQPVLVRKGCMMAQCHSPAMFHEYRLRGGTAGALSYFASMRNYKTSLLQLNLESSDVTASRIVRKNLFRQNNGGLPPPTPLGGPSGPTDSGGGPSEGGASPEGGAPGGGGPPLGVLHRGGALFEDFGNDEPSGPACDSAAPPYDYVNGDLNAIPAFCVIRHWHQLERSALKNFAPLSGIVYVLRPPPSGQPDRAQDFDVYAGGATLHIQPASINAATGQLQLAGMDAQVNVGMLCGLSGSLDIQRPAVSWNGSKIAFAARADMASPLQVYEMDAKGTTCTKHPLNDLTKFPLPSACPQPPAGILIHNFDPQYAPDGQLVFASTRGNLDDVQPNFDYCGPQLTPADVSKPNSNLYVYEPDPNNQGQFHLRQLTFLLDMERYPSFMSDGRLIFTTEKREPGFYELALRRINLDGGDYHPLYSQRGTIGYYEATQAVELADKNFATIFSNPKAIHGGGALGLFNRSLGVDFHSTNAADYLVDPSVIDPAAPTFIEDGTPGIGQPVMRGIPNFFLHSLSLPDPNASGTPGTPGTIYRSPSPLPSGGMLVSVAASADPATFSGAFDVYELNPETGVNTKVIAGNGQAAIQAVGIYARGYHGTFASTYDEPNGHTTITQGLGVDLTILDMGVLGSLLFQNTPTGRLIEGDLNGIDVFEELPPDSPSPAMSFVANDMVGWTGSVVVRRRMLGHVPLAADGSAHLTLPGGVPIVLRLGDTSESQSKKLPRFQREEMEFAPGEVVNQAFPRGFFNALCAQCHGSITGKFEDVAVTPDILTQASMVVSRGSTPTNLNLSPPQRTSSIVGPPSTP